MKDQLAEELLAKVMGWKSPQDFVEHGLPLQAIAAYKYDEYQQFSPGMRFIESLALWLGQFETIEKRRVALKLVRERLVFISSAELNHLVSISYPDHIRPFLLSKSASESGLMKWQRGKVASSQEFRCRERRCLFLGLSDGSHTDLFRRANPHLQNDQVRQSHELSEERVQDLKAELTKDLAKIYGREPSPQEAVFRSVVLLDDFSASGLSYIRPKPDGSAVGKVGKFLMSLRDRSKPLCNLFTDQRLEIILVLYMATQTAEQVLSDNLAKLCATCGHESKVLIVQRFPESLRICRGTIPELDQLIASHYDAANESTSTALGGTDLKYGFAGGGLPLILRRFEALTPDEMLSSGMSEGRDYEGEILLEQFWRSHSRKFENLLMSVADKRASAAINVEVSSLDSCLQASLDAPEWQEKYEAAIPVIRQRVSKTIEGRSVFSVWMDSQEAVVGTPRDRAIGWRAFEILVHREIKHEQRSFDFPLDPSVLAERSDSQVRAAAELFLSQEFELPYYFGTHKLANLASWNIEQFMRLAGDEFEEVVSSRIVRKTPTLDAGRQDELLRVASISLWNEIPRRAKNGENVLKLLDSIGRFCRQRTYEASAPYDPGVTGIAISMRDKESLQDRDFLGKNPQYSLLADVLAAAIANNLLEPLLDYRVKGSTWMVLNLNRLLCVNFDLPLHYGGFKEQRLHELYSWMTAGYKPKLPALI